MNVRSKRKDNSEFRKDMTPEEYLTYLNNQAKNEKFEHDGLESWEIKEGVKEGMPKRHPDKSKKKVG